GGPQLTPRRVNSPACDWCDRWEEKGRAAFPWRPAARTREGNYINRLVWRWREERMKTARMVGCWPRRCAVYQVQRRRDAPPGAKKVGPNPSAFLEKRIAGACQSGSVERA